MKRTTLIEILCGLIFLLFFYATAAKFWDLAKFTRQINAQPYPNFLTPVIVPLLLAVETFITFGVMINRTRRIALKTSIWTMAFFTVYTAVMLSGAVERVPCACGGLIAILSWPQHFALNTGFLAISIWAYRLLRKEQKEKQITALADKILNPAT